LYCFVFGGVAVAEIDKLSLLFFSIDITFEIFLFFVFYQSTVNCVDFRPKENTFISLTFFAQFFKFYQKSQRENVTEFISFLVADLVDIHALFVKNFEQ
jgi:hypothetical protein